MRFLVPVLLLSIVGLVVSTIDGTVSEATAATGVAACVITLCIAYGLVPLAALANRPLATALVFALGAVTFAAGLLPVLETLSPGRPLATAELAEIGQSVALPAEAEGPVRVLVHARLPQAPSHLQLTMSAPDQKLEAELSSTKATVRVGRRGRGTTVQHHESQFMDARIARGTRELTLTRAAGSWPVPLRVEVFREWLPDWALFAVSAVLLCLVALLSAAAGAPGRVSGGVACGLFFGIALHYLATPDSALRPEVGALLVGLLGATLATPLLIAGGNRLLTRTTPAQ